MRVTARRLVLCVLSCVGVVYCSVLCCGAIASGTEGSSLTGEATGGPLAEDLVVPGSPLEGQLLLAQREAQLKNPVAVAERVASRTKFAGLRAGQAMALAAATFPGLVNEPAGGLPRVAGVQQVTGFPSDRAASVDLDGGRHGLIESLDPIAVKDTSGRRVPVDLSLHAVGGAFKPVTPLVAVRIPRRLSDGIQLGNTGVSVTPVGGPGAPVGGSEGQLTGASVFYASTQLDTDTVIKPTSSGFEASAVLRSAQSPERIAYRVSMPKGAKLVQSGSGAVQIIKDRAVLAGVFPPNATDAAGASVPVSMTVSGDMLTVVVHLAGGEWAYPVAVDPYYYIFDGYKGGERYRSNWELKGGPEKKFELKRVGNEYVLEQKFFAQAGEYALVSYSTQGESRIAQLEAEVNGANEKEAKDFMRIFKGKVGEGGEHVEWEYRAMKGLLRENHLLYAACEKPSCKYKEGFAYEELGSEENTAQVGIETYGSVSGKSDYLKIPKDIVLIWQAKGPEAHVNKTNSSIDEKSNVLYGSGGWLGPNSNSVFEVEDHDPGVGISKAVTSASGWSETYEPLNIEDDQCTGPECPPNYDPVFAYNSKMANGEDTLSATAEDDLEGKAELEGGIKLKVDDTKPHGLTTSGLPSDDELGEGTYRLKAEVVDGSGTTKVAGIAAINVLIDGHAMSATVPASCPESLECTAKGEWLISGASVGVGEHTLTVEARDRAGNAETETYTLKVHHATPVAVGPGAVNPQSGVFGMTATDVSIPVPGGSLTVTRNYEADAGERTSFLPGPLGQSWKLAVGGQESIVPLPNGNVTLTTASGGQTTFALVGGKYTSPSGDSNLALTEVTGERGPELVLKDASDGSTTRFVTTTSSVWTPAKQEGPLNSQTVRYTFQTTAEHVTEPVHAFAPEAPGVTCGEESKAWKAGCRVLTFEYARETSAKGEKPSEWGSYRNELEKIVYTTYSPTTKEMVTVSVADYSYDLQDRLRAEWNPEISPSLKTTYGWEESMVSAVSPAGQEPWLLNYGSATTEATLANPAPEALLSAIRPAAATPAELKAQEEEAPPVNTAVPSLSSTKPAVGSKITVSSEGTWNNSPLVYRYKWDACPPTHGECKVIPGAVNQSYYPTKSVEGFELRGEVVAYNAGGATVAHSAQTTPVASGTANSPAPEPPAVGTSSVWTVEYQAPLSGSTELPTMTKEAVEKWGQKSEEVPAEATAVFPPDSPEGWPAKTYARATVSYLDGRSRPVNLATPTGGVSTREYNNYNDVIRTLSADNRATALKETCESKEKCKSAELAKLLSTENTYEEKGSEPGTELLSTLGPEHKVELTNGAQVAAREHTIYSYDEGAPETGGPYHVVTKTTEGATVAGTEEPESVRTTKMGYSGTGSQENIGWKLRKPTSVTTDPNGLDLVRTTEYEPNTGEVKETKTPAATGHDAKIPPTYSLDFGSEGTEAGQLAAPEHDALDSHGDLWVTDFGNNRVEEFSSTGKFMLAVGWGVKDGKAEAETCTSECKAGISGTGKAQFNGPVGIAINQTNNDIYISDFNNNRIEELSSAGAWLATFGAKGTAGGDFSSPEGVTVDSSGDVWVADAANSRIQELSASGTFMLAVGWGVEDGKGEPETCTSSCEAGISGSGNGQLAGPNALTFSGGDFFVADYANDRIDEFSAAGAYVAKFGEKGTGTGQFEGPHDIATEAATGDLYVLDKNDGRVQKFTTGGSFLSTFATEGSGNGQLEGAQGLAINASNDLYAVDSVADRVEEWVPTITGNEGAHDTKTIYYTAKEEAELGECRNHPEWAGLPCQTGPVTQPGTSGLPELPVTTYKEYNLWLEPTLITETVGTTAPIPTRTKTDTYDSAGRLKTAGTTATTGTALPTVTYGYTAKEGAETGAMTTQSTLVEGKTLTVTSVRNTRGELVSYTDASGVTSTYEYDEDERLHKSNDGKGTQTFTYSKTTGLPSELVDSAHEGMKFTATWDVEGNMLSESYPNGMTEYHTYSPTGTATGLEYKKLTDCTEEKEKCKWFTDTIVPSIHGQWLSQTSTFSKQAYVYNHAGALSEVQNTPTGKDCTTRLYALDEDINRTSLTTRESTTEKCATEGGTTESHTYDTADRLTDPGVTYNEFGDITTLPASDANGKTTAEKLTSTYYVDNQLATQTQNEQTFGYNLDPAGRTMETVSTGKKVADVASNYAGPGNEPSWTTNVSSETSRNIQGIDGQLVAIQNNSELPVLELINLHGDIIATASYTETATELASKADTSEFGVPALTVPPKYSWLGALELSTEELPSGAINMGARSYVPEIGRFLQPDPFSGGSANAYSYSYTFGDPVNSSDPTGDYTASYVNAFDEEWAAGASERQAIEIARIEAERHAAEEAAARAAAEIAAKQAALAAQSAAGPQYGEEEEWEEWGEEEGEYEYVSDHQGGTPGKEEPHIEPAVLVQSLVGEGRGGNAATFGSPVPLCEGGSTGPCARDARGGPGAACHSKSGKKRCHKRIERLKNSNPEELSAEEWADGYCAYLGFTTPEACAGLAIWQVAHQ